MPTDAAQALGYFSFLYAMMIPLLIVGVVFYVFVALALMKLADKTKTPNGWLGWIPVANIYLMTQLAGVAWWWFLIAIAAGFIPVVGGIITAIIMIWWWMKIAVRVNRPSWWGIMFIIPLVNFIFLGIMAWGNSAKSEK